MLIKTIAASLGQRLADKLATEIVCAVAKECPETVDKIAAEAKGKQDAKRRARDL